MLFNFKQYDIFFSYVVEDREVIDSLCKGLTDKGLRVWYAKEQLKAGDNIINAIHEGLKNVHYGLVLISPRYKGYWSGAELFFLLSNKKNILPILHEKTIEEVAVEIPGIYDKYCLNTNTGIENVIDGICKSVKRKSKLYYIVANIFRYLLIKRQKVLRVFFILFCLAVTIAANWYYQFIRPTDEIIENAIKQRVSAIENLSKKELEEHITDNECTAVPISELIKAIPSTNNRYIFFNGNDYIQALSTLKRTGIIPSAEPVVPPFGLTDCKVYQCKSKEAFNGIKYILINLLPNQYKITDNRLNDDVYEVDVQYTSAIRYIEITIYTDEIGKSFCTIYLLGNTPNETLVFEKNNKNWMHLMTQ